MYPSCTVKKQFKETENEGSLKVATHNNCNYVDCKYNILLTMECSDTSCNNWFKINTIIQNIIMKLI